MTFCHFRTTLRGLNDGARPFLVVLTGLAHLSVETGYLIGGVMLILTRCVGETLNIGDTVQVVVLGVKGKSVRIGINAPREVPVFREEIYKRIQQERAKQ